ncbi:MAG: hypothetical protein AAGL99_05290 [Pseudomonadota bacterium]
MTRQSPFRMANIITFIAALLTIGTFVAIVMWPNAPATPADTTPLTERPLAEALNDELTHAYLTTLHRVEPKLSRELHETAEQAIADGATQDDLAIMVISAYNIGLRHGFDDFIKADVKYFEKMLKLIQTELSSLSFNDSKFCRMASLETLSQQTPEQAIAEIQTMLAYDSRTYQWVLRYSVLKLLAIDDGRTNPKSYKRMTRADKAEFQAMFMRLLRSRSFAQLSTARSASPVAQRQALKTMNLCKVGAEALAAVNNLPPDMKSRMLIELKKMQKKSEIKKQARELFGDSCGLCSAF